MREILLTSSVLILALLALRRLFWKTLSRRVQYALWGLAALRLLLPINLPAADFSLLTAAEPAAPQIDGQSLYLYPSRITLTASEDSRWSYSYKDDPPIILGPTSDDNVYSFTDNQQVLHEVEYSQQIILNDLKALLGYVWLGGSALMSCWLFLSNFRFWRNLCKARKPYNIGGCKYRVYWVEEGLSSPCLFGLFRPAVYLTPAALRSPDSLRHILAHEETHARHGDPFWALLRGFCLTVYWFNPLVWWAALASQTDCELACDEGALARLGNAERISYGRTLLALIPVHKNRDNPLLSATTMTADKRRLKERITRIAECRTGLGGRAAFAAIALVGLVCAVTFTGASKPEAAPSDTVEQAVGALAEELSENNSFSTNLVVYTPENPPTHFDLKKGEILRVYWGMYVSLSSDLSNPLGWFCSLYQIDTLDYFGDGPGTVTKQIGNDGRYLYVLTHPQWSPELKSGQTQGSALMWQVIERIQETVLSCREVRQAAETARPDWEPIYTVSLNNLEPYEPQAAEPVPFPYGSFQIMGDLEDPEHVLGNDVLMFFQAGDQIFAGLQSPLLSSLPTPFWSFRPGAGGKYSASLFRNLLGHNGFCITYHANDGPRTITNEYYYLDETGWPVLLAQAEGTPERIDLDGDGVKELVSDPFGGLYQLWCRRGNQIYQLNLDQILGSFWPEHTNFYYGNWESGGLPFEATFPSNSNEEGFQRENRTLYFDGDYLLVYNDQRHFENHILNWPDLPGEIITAAQEVVQQEFEAAGDLYDDWRISHIHFPQTLVLQGKTYWICKVSCEFHTPEPRDTKQGFSDRWGDPFSPKALYLVFREEEQNGLSYVPATYLYTLRQEAWPSLQQLLERLPAIPSSLFLLPGEEDMEPLEMTGVPFLQIPPPSTHRGLQTAAQSMP